MERIQHVVVLMLENKSFHNVFGDFEGVLGSMREKRNRQRWVNKDLDGKFYRPKKIDDPYFRFSKYLDNSAIITMRQMENHNTGFVKVLHEAFKENNIVPEEETEKIKKSKKLKKQQQKQDPDLGSTALGQPLYYFKKGTLPCTHTLADHFVICDHYFASAPSSTWSTRLMALSGTSRGIYETPMSITEIPFDRMVRQTQETIFDLMLEAKLSFKVFYGDFPLSLLLESNWKPEILEHHRLMSEFYEACKIGDESKFPHFVWIEPTYGEDGNSNHPPSNPQNAEALIGNIYNAIRKNEALWQKTMFIITSDEGGGGWESAIPPLAWEHRHRINNVLHTNKECRRNQVPDTHADTDLLQYIANSCHSVCKNMCGFDVNQVYNIRPPAYCRHIFGLRVPTLVISPWLSPRVESCTYDHTSILNTICERWNLDATRLGPRTPLATTFWHMFPNSNPHMKDQDAHLHHKWPWAHPLQNWFHTHLSVPRKTSSATKANISAPNKFGLLHVPKHDKTHYSGQAGNWSRFQIDMFNSICWAAHGLGRLPSICKHPLLTLEKSWSDAIEFVKNIW